ncbi:MAG: zinc ribbon domain-containing protein [Deltaproteobacteria bacterium]|jgi:putative FmdB family regulatory protein|nr:zinc ribbon domain-containing protein [Deltaproteobacteria bacterium]
MPTYEYRCESTGRIFEQTQSMSDEPTKICPECGGPATRLVSGGTGVIFKGHGFYSTDYAGNSRERTQCGRETTCCGRQTPCESPQCKR